MKTIFKKLILSASLTAAVSMTAMSSIADEGIESVGAAVFNKKGELLLPQDFQKWVFLGAPLTPNGLNNGQAGFPEFHHVYMNPDAFAVYQQTGVFPDGTVLAKELALLVKGDHDDGSTNAPSGRGFFASEFHGMDVAVKDSKRFKETNGWGYFNFGHHAPPYKKTAAAAPAANCAACHQASAEKDMVFTQYYPILRQ